MATFAAALKDEMRRMARKVMRAETGVMKQAVAQFRRDIARLKRQLRQQERKLAFFETQERKRLTRPAAAAKPADNARFSARSVRAQRKRLKLSAAEYAKLAGVSSLTIYNWEHGKSRPRAPQLAALVTLRGLGRREALAKLELLGKK